MVKGVLIILLGFCILPGLWSEEDKESDEKSLALEPGKHYSTTTIGYSMGSSRQGVFTLETVELAGNSNLGFGIGAQLNFFAIPQVEISMNGITTSDTWSMTMDIGPGIRFPGLHFGNKNEPARLVCWLHIAPLFSFAGYFLSKEEEGLIYIFELGFIVRESITLYFSDNFGLSIDFGLGAVVNEFAELKNGNSVATGTYAFKDYPYLYLDANLGLTFRY